MKGPAASAAKSATSVPIRISSPLPYAYLMIRRTVRIAAVLNGQPQPRAAPCRDSPKIAANGEPASARAVLDACQSAMPKTRVVRCCSSLLTTNPNYRSDGRRRSP